MKKTICFLFTLAVITPACLHANKAAYEIIEQNNLNRLQELYNTSLFNVSQAEKKDLLKVARQKVNETELNVSKFGLNEASRLALGLSAELFVALPLLAIGVFCQNWALLAEEGARQKGQQIPTADLQDADKTYKKASIPILLASGIVGYWGIDTIIKAFNRTDNKAKHQRSLAIEALIRRIKAKK